MRTVVLVAILAVGACSKSGEPVAADVEEVPILTVDEVSRKLASGGIPVDANGARTRKKLGTLPGALLLSDYETFSLSELPADKSKTLVFYCTNTYCSASHEAAAKARSSGYTNVAVMADGIVAWKKAGHPIQTP